MIEVELIHSEAKVPNKSHQHDGGYDITSIEDFNLMSGELKLCKTGIKIGIPEGYVGLLRGRSGLGVQGIDPLEFYYPDTQPLVLLGGVIDSNYRGEVGVIIKNLGSGIKIIKKGDRICQIIMLKIWDGGIMMVKKLGETDRGSAGFGSSDIPKELLNENVKKIMVPDPAQYLKK